MNRLAKTIHDVCAKWEGAANKNYGHAYLIVWNIEGTSKRREEERRAG